MISKAYSVLSEPASRRKYDKEVKPDLYRYFSPQDSTA